VDTSLISHLAISLISSPARLSAMGIAREGAMVKSMGFVAASPQLRIRASGFAESDFDFSKVVRTRADAPSLMAEALAAVTVPFFLSSEFVFGITWKRCIWWWVWLCGVEGEVLEYGFELRYFFKF